MEQTLAGLGKRVFLMHNVHEDEPVVFHTRWAMSYLRGPLTREQIKRLPQERETAAAPPATPRSAPRGTAAAPVTEAEATASRPVLAPGVRQVFLPLRDEPEGDLAYRAALLGLGRVQYVDRKTKKLKHAEDVAVMLPLDEQTIAVDWSDAEPVDVCLEDLEPEPDGEASYGAIPAVAEKPMSYRKWRKGFSDALYRNRSLDLFKSPGLGLIAEPGESEGEFRARLSQLAREKRDRMADELRRKYARRVTRLEDRLRRAVQRVEKEAQQASGQKMQTAISLGATVLSAFLGRKKLSYGTLGRATTTMRGMGRAAREKQDVARAKQNMEALQAQLAELNQELEAELDALEDNLDAQVEKLETVALRPRRSDVDVRLVALAWEPRAQSRR
jgi:hypothetical protein